MTSRSYHSLNRKARLKVLVDHGTYCKHTINFVFEAACRRQAAIEVTYTALFSLFSARSTTALIFF